MKLILTLPVIVFDAPQPEDKSEPKNIKIQKKSTSTIPEGEYLVKETFPLDNGGGTWFELIDTGKIINLYPSNLPDTIALIS